MIHIIYANPRKGGHSGLFLEEVQKQLDAKNEAYTVHDLYEEEFDPVLKPGEVYTAGGKDISDQADAYHTIFSDNNRFIFIYPIWWNSMPAMLKGFFDRVFTNKIAFEYRRVPLLWFAIPFGLWKGKKAAVFVSTGAKGWQSLLFLGNNFKSLVSQHILGFCGMKSKVWHLDSCMGRTTGREKEVKNLVRKGLAWLK